MLEMESGDGKGRSYDDGDLIRHDCRYRLPMISKRGSNQLKKSTKLPFNIKCVDGRVPGVLNALI
jgi:hypothetical protein